MPRPKPPAPLVPRYVRMSDAEFERFREMGGAAWLRAECRPRPPGYWSVFARPSPGDSVSERSGIESAPMAQTPEKREAQNPALLVAGSRPDVLAWRQQSGVFRSYDDPSRVVRAGVPGLADCGMVVAVTITPDMVGRTVGVAVQAEFKAERGAQSDAQKRWQAAVEQRGGVYAVVRSADGMRALIERVSSGEHWRGGR